MRVLAIGLGGSGARIADHLYDHDQRSKVGCMNVVAIDTDANTLLQLRYLPDGVKIHFPSIDPDQHVDARTTIDIEEIMTRIQKLDTVEIDSIMVFGGLGGSMVDVISLIVPELRKSFIEPIFAVLTLPCLSEGKKKAAKAADDIDMIESHVDGIILFDNETWYRKIKEACGSEAADAKGMPFGISRKGSLSPDNPRDVYRMLNERIARQVGLLLRAGEFNEEGIEAAEVVLDAGEILNTLGGNGMVAVGYASEMLPHTWFDMFDRWRSARFFFEGATQRAARIVSLAKQAVYEDISIPCDLTSADKALILIAGPSRELSFKGFQTVRKWIDRSIAGLEMRSGDYPVRNTKYVGIIVMLSGLYNIPRLEEIRALREEYLVEKELAARKKARDAHQDDGMQVETGEMTASDTDSSSAAHGVADPEEEKDEMITLTGITAADRKTKPNVVDDAIVLQAAKKQKKGSHGIAIPKKAESSQIDITGKAEGGARKAPKESALGVRDVNINLISPRQVPGEEGGVIVKSPPKAKDGIIDGDRVSVSPMRAPVKEGIINGESVPVTAKGGAVREILGAGDQVRLRTGQGSAKEKSFDKAGRSLERAKAQPREVDPARRRLTVIGEPEERQDDPADADDDLFWIT